MCRLLAYCSPPPKGIVLKASCSPKQLWHAYGVLCCWPLARQNNTEQRLWFCAVCLLLTDDNLGSHAAGLLLTSTNMHTHLWGVVRFASCSQMVADGAMQASGSIICLSHCFDRCWSNLCTPSIHVSCACDTFHCFLWSKPSVVLRQDIQASTTYWFLKREAIVFNAIWILHEKICIFTRISEFLKRRWLPLESSDFNWKTWITKHNNITHIGLLRFWLAMSLGCLPDTFHCFLYSNP